MSVIKEFDNKNDIIHWAESCFFGGCKTYTVERDDKELLVVEGMPTSGLCTTEIAVYHRDRERYKLVAFRNRVPGMAVFEENGLMLHFRVEGVSILSFSWDSIDRDLV